METNLPISPKLNFISNTLGCYGLSKFQPEALRVRFLGLVTASSFLGTFTTDLRRFDTHKFEI